jgi:phosphoribosylaminoimidazole-succinocarboxamide synthase
VELVHQGKVRDLYADGDDLLMVASDRVSIYDVVLPTPIPDKGAILTRLSLWWFDRLADIVPNQVISATDVPAEFAGRAIRVRRLDMLPASTGPGRGAAAARAHLHPVGEGAGRRAR